MSFASRIKEQRERIGLSRKDLADLMGITASAVANYENGISSPKAELLYSLMDALKCDANYLYQDEMDETGGVPIKLLYAEYEHIKKYRALDEHGKKIVDLVLDEELRRMDEQHPLKIAARTGVSLKRSDDLDSIPLIGEDSKVP